MQSKKALFPIILFVGCAAQIASDIYAPSLPAISAALHTPIMHVQFSMVIYMFGLAFSQLFYGPISEGFGRRIPLMIGLALMVVGNIISLFSPTIGVLIAGRLVQGCGAGACSVLWRSIFRDTFEGNDLAKYGAYLSIFVTFIIPAAPTLGGYLQEWFDWRASFAFLTIYTLCTLSLVFFRLKETSKHHHRDRMKPSFITTTFKHVLSSPIFVGYTLCTFLCYGAFFSWFAVGPVLLIKQVGISPSEFGWLTFLCSGMATAFGGFFSGRLVSTLGTATMMRTGFSLVFISGMIMLISKFIWGIHTWDIVLPMAIFYFGVTFVWPSAFAGAFGPFGKIAGYAGALYGFMQIGGAAVLGTVVSYLPHTNQVPLACIFILTAIIAASVFEMTYAREQHAKA
ncbi:MAG TPA: multidrug effflux MFS transporter [Gammaproteobacteria bacterium]|nr:multidrug effflux MFS transporter [Gammaproteobacteria bacterium]